MKHTQCILSLQNNFSNKKHTFKSSTCSIQKSGTHTGCLQFYTHTHTRAHAHTHTQTISSNKLPNTYIANLSPTYQIIHSQYECINYTKLKKSYTTFQVIYILNPAKTKLTAPESWSCLIMALSEFAATVNDTYRNDSNVLAGSQTQLYLQIQSQQTFLDILNMSSLFDDFMPLRT